MLPQSIYGIREVEETVQSSTTYRMDFKSKRIIGKIDGFDAVVQSVHKILNTERFAYVIYNADYGVELETLIGKDRNFVVSAIGQRIGEALEQDDRITGISDFVINNLQDDEITVAFTVNTIYGDYEYTGEVV